MKTRVRVVKRLTGYKFYRNHEDVGSEVRSRAREVLSLITSDEKLEAKKNAAKAKVASGEPQRYQRDYVNNDPWQQQQPQQQHYQISQHAHSGGGGRDPLSNSASDSADSPSRSNQRSYESSSFEPKSQAVSKPRRRDDVEKTSKERRRGSGSERQKKKSSKESKEKRERKKKKKRAEEKARAAQQAQAQAQAYSVESPSDDEEDMSTRQARRAMAGVQLQDDSGAAPVDFLTGQGSNVVSTDWMNDMNFQDVDVANTNAFFDAPVDAADGSPEHDGFAFDDALEIDSDDEVDASKSATGNFWDTHGGLADVSDLRANEYTKKPKKPVAGKTQQLTLQQIAQKNANEEANALAIRPAENQFAISPVPQAAQQQYAYGTQSPAMPYGVQQQGFGAPVQAYPQQQIAMQPYGMAPGPMQPYGLPPANPAYGNNAMVPHSNPPAPDPFGALNRQGSKNMWQM